jgi:hypothetical protein
MLHHFDGYIVQESNQATKASLHGAAPAKAGTKKYKEYKRKMNSQ